MGITELFAFFKALPAMVEEIKQLRLEVSKLRQDAIDKELASIQKEVDVQIQILAGAHTDEERKKALLALSTATHR